MTAGFWIALPLTSSLLRAIPMSSGSKATSRTMKRTGSAGLGWTRKRRTASNTNVSPAPESLRQPLPPWLPGIDEARPFGIAARARMRSIHLFDVRQPDAGLQQQPGRFEKRHMQLTAEHR